MDRHGRKLPRDDGVLVFSDAYPNRGWVTRDDEVLNYFARKLTQLTVALFILLT